MWACVQLGRALLLPGDTFCPVALNCSFSVESTSASSPSVWFCIDCPKTEQSHQIGCLRGVGFSALMKVIHQLIKSLDSSLDQRVIAVFLNVKHKILLVNFVSL